jgi:hypothetical protein
MLGRRGRITLPELDIKVIKRLRRLRQALPART